RRSTSTVPGPGTRSRWSSFPRWWRRRPPRRSRRCGGLYERCPTSSGQRCSCGSPPTSITPRSARRWSAASRRRGRTCAQDWRRSERDGHMDDRVNRLLSRAEAEGLVDVAYAETDSPVGRLLLAATDRGLVRVSFQREDREGVLEELAAEL